MKEVIIDKSKTIQIPVIIGNEEDLMSRGFAATDVYAPLLMKDVVYGGGQFFENYPRAIFINTDDLFHVENAEFFSLIAYSMRFAIENSSSLYGYIINHLYELCDLDHETLEELLEEIYKVHRKIIINKTKEERKMISLMEALEDCILSIDAFPSCDCVAYGCIAGAYYSARSGLLSKEEYYEIRDMFVPFGLPISQTRLNQKELYEIAYEHLNNREDLNRILVLKKIGKLNDAFELENKELFNEDIFDSIYFDENNYD